MPGARIPVVQREEDPADEDKHWDQDKVGGKPGCPEEGEEGIAPEVQGRYSQPADHRRTEEAEAQQVCGLLVGLREHDRELVAHAGDDPEDAGDRGEDREEPEGLRTVEAGDDRSGQDGDDLGDGSAGDEFEDVGGEGG